MEYVENFFVLFTDELKKADFALLITLSLAAFAGIFTVSLLACAFSRGARAHRKNAFMYLVNLFTALNLAIFLIKFSLIESVFLSALFWCLGGLLYGLLCLFKPVPPREFAAQPGKEAPTLPPFPITRGVSAEKNVGSVRLDHAVAIADKLLLKALGRQDRQELERMKIDLNVLKVKESLTAKETELLNQTFNSLLKLMAKYDV